MPGEFSLSGFIDNSLFSAAVQSCEKTDLSILGIMAVNVIWDTDSTVSVFQHVWEKILFKTSGQSF